MTLEEARAKLSRLTDATAKPVLDQADLDALLGDTRTVDADGNAPDSDDWGGAWDFNRAAVAGWELKAGRVAELYDTTTDGMTLSRSQIGESFRLQAKRFRRKIGGSV